MDGAVVLGTASLNAMRQATLTTSALAPGPTRSRRATRGCGLRAEHLDAPVGQGLQPAGHHQYQQPPRSRRARPGRRSRVTTTGIPHEHDHPYRRPAQRRDVHRQRQQHGHHRRHAGGRDRRPARPTCGPSPRPTGFLPSADAELHVQRRLPGHHGQRHHPGADRSTPPMAAATFTQAGGNGAIAWSASGLPTGLTINSATGDGHRHPDGHRHVQRHDHRHRRGRLHGLDEPDRDGGPGGGGGRV